GGYSGRFGGMPVYFVARAGQPIASFGTWVGRTATAGATDATGAQSGAWLTFAPSTTSVVLEVAISFVDLEGARANLAAEGAGFDFDAARAAAESAWEAELSRVRIEGRSDAAFTRFYSALYHTLLMPTLAADADGRYRGLDGEVHSASFRYHTDFSLWDTYRSLHPWLTLAYPAHQQNMLRSLIAMGTDGGMMPRWPLGIGYTGGMLGDPAAIVFADSWIKGLRDYDLRAAYTALRRSAQGEPNPLFGGRGSAEPYNRLGYVPLESGGSAAARTLEFAYADHAMAILAEALGETDDQAMFATRARSWRNTYDPARGFFVARHEDGRFRDGFREDLWVDDYAEGNAWQYLWLVPQDASGLAELLGGEAMARARLTHFFEESYRERRGLGPPRWYWHGNEPDMHACALFSAWGDPAAGSRWCAWVREAFYGEGPEGLPGNDDGGTMSAWYVFAALGLMPFAATDRYWIVAPEVTRATIAVEGGVLTIEAPGASDRTPYVTSATIDGEPLPDLSITHARLTAGATLRLEASETAR
ncbi:MAG: GH92 family glycosyl hydrolase, partial [Sandaracinaceae bacterium]|nr:GH92 family glycosyl hydrolase [Sandaracinaceae bacterium]